jgi:hypothetical protein
MTSGQEKLSRNGRSGTLHWRRRILLCVIGGTICLFLVHAFAKVRRSSYHPPKRFPQEIWQSWKVDSLRLEELDLVRSIRLGWINKVGDKLSPPWCIVATVVRGRNNFDAFRGATFNIGRSAGFGNINALKLRGSGSAARRLSDF